MFEFLSMMSMLLFAPVAEDPTRSGQALIDAIETVQQPVEDFRCEFEGSIRFKGTSHDAQTRPLGEDGLSETFSGIFIWKRTGDTFVDILHRMEPAKNMTRNGIAVRMSRAEAEESFNHDNERLGVSLIKSPNEIETWRADSYGWIFLIDKLKRLVANSGYTITVTDDLVDGRKLKVFNVGLTGMTDLILQRYWVDLGRNGHVVKRETYDADHKLSSRTDITLASFRIGKEEVWMPTAGETVGYVGLVDNKPVTGKTPALLETIYVANGAMSFNRHPGPEVFTLKYRPGTPISDNVRQMNYQYGQQKVGVVPTVAEAERMLKEQIAQAEEQKGQLSRRPPDREPTGRSGSPGEWSRWSPRHSSR